MKQVGVVGGGTMGTGIVYVCASVGMAVFAVEPDNVRASVMQENLERAVAGGVKRGKLDPDGGVALLARIRRLSSVSEMPVGLDLIVETVPERLELKREVLAGISAREPGYIGTNTSALSIDLLSQSVDEPERFIG